MLYQKVMEVADVGKARKFVAEVKALVEKMWVACLL